VYGRHLCRREEFDLAAATLGYLALVVLLVAFLGNFLFLYIQRRYDLSSKNIVVINLILIGLLGVFILTLFCVIMCAASYGLIGFIPGSPFGLVTVGELFVFGGIFGLNFGSVQAHTRFLYSVM